MALPASGAISLGQVNTELGISPSTTSINMNQASVRTLFAVASGPIAMSNGHGKSAASPPVFPSVTNYPVNDRSWSGGGEGIAINSSYYSPTPSASGSVTWAYAAATGGGITYEWQFLPYHRFMSSCTNAQNTTPLVGSAQTWNGPSGYNDSISGASSNSLTITGRPYYGTATYHGASGFWRLKASNSAGATYTKWHLVVKLFDTYSYSCNCTCPTGESYTYDCNCYCGCGTNDCNCDENNENCSQCCDNCSETCSTCDGCFVSEVCDTCENYQTSDLGDGSGCNW